MKNFLYFIIAVTTLSSCMKKVTLEEQEINLSQLIKDIDNDMLKKECKYSINAIVTGYCDRKLDKHQLSWIDLYGKIEMRHPSDDKPFLTCTRKKTESHYSFWEECNSIKFYLRNYRSCKCRIATSIFNTHIIIIKHWLILSQMPEKK